MEFIAEIIIPDHSELAGRGGPLYTAGQAALDRGVHELGEIPGRQISGFSLLDLLLVGIDQLAALFGDYTRLGDRLPLRPLVLDYLADLVQAFILLGGGQIPGEHIPAELGDVIAEDYLHIPQRPLEDVQSLVQPLQYP